MLRNLVAGIVLGILGLVILTVLSLIHSVPMYFLWNGLMPNIFGIKTITFWQAWGLTFLVSLLFKNSSSSIQKS